MLNRGLRAINVVGAATVLASLSTYSANRRTLTEELNSGTSSTKTEARERQLLEWNGRGPTLERLNRGDLYDVDKKRRVVALIGITGSGKSSTANTMIKGSHSRYFDTADSLTSVTKSVNFRDYEFKTIPFRVIDSPGLYDTNRSQAEVQEEIQKFAKFAKHGVSCFLVVLPKGRITPETERSLMLAKRLFGEDINKYGAVVFTSCLGSNEGVGSRRQLLTRDVLIEEINKLEPDHFLRKLVGDMSLRILPVENKLEPFRTICKFTIHQTILDVEQANHGERYEVDEASLLHNLNKLDYPQPKPKECSYIRTKLKDGTTKLEVTCKPRSKVPTLLANLLDHLQ